MRRVVLILAILLVGLSCSAQTHTAPALDVPSTFTADQGFTHNTLGFVNVITNCGLTGDGVTNDGAALAACLAANPGKRIFFPKTQAVGSCDYRVNGSILLPSGHGQIWEGEGAGWAGEGTRICKTAEDGNPLVDTVHANCQNCTIENLHFSGPSPWSSVTLTQNIPPCTPSNGQTYAAGIVCVNAGDGLLIEAGFTALKNIYVENFGRNGIVFTSNFGGFPDNFNLINVTSNNNRGDGFYFKGGDVNAGSSLQLHAYNNAMYCLDDQGFLGNSHYSPQVTGCHPASSTIGATSSITAATRTANVVTLTAAGHNASTGNVIVVAGVADSSFNGTFSISSVTSTTITYAQTAGNASSSGGTVRLTSNNEFYAATGMVGGSYNLQQAAAWNTLYSPYCEGGQNPITGQSKLLVLGGDQGCGIDYTNSPLVIGQSVNNSGIASANFLTGTAGFAFITPTDTSGMPMNWAAGKTADKTIEHRFMGGHSLNIYWDWVHNVGGTEAGNTATLSLYRGGNGTNLRAQFTGPGVGGVNQFNDEGTSTRFNNQTGSSGNIEFYSAGGGQLIHDFLSNGQYAMTPSANGIDMLSIKRFTDSSPAGNFLNFKSAAAVPIFQVSATGLITINTTANNLDLVTILRGTDSSPAGNFVNFVNHANNTSLWTVDITGKLVAGTMDAARVTSGAFPKAQQMATTMYTDQANTITAGKLTTLASATSGAGFNIPAGVAPTSPAIGDHWMVGANVFYRDNSGTPVTQTLEIQSNKDAVNGYAGLTAGSLLKTAEFPALTGDVTSSAGGVNTTVSNAIVPKFVGTPVSSPGLSGAVVSTNLLAAAPAGTYRVSFYVTLSQQATTSSSVSLSIGFNDGNNTSTISTANSTTNLLGVAAFAQPFNFIIRSAAAQNITYSTTYASTGGTPMKYDLYIQLEKIQ